MKTILLLSTFLTFTANAELKFNGEDAGVPTKHELAQRIKELEAKIKTLSEKLDSLTAPKIITPSSKPAEMVKTSVPNDSQALLIDKTN